MNQLILKKHLKTLLDHPTWAAMEEMKRWTVEQWQAESVVGDTVEQTGMRALQKEYKILAINEFFEKLEQMAHDNDARIQRSDPD